MTASPELVTFRVWKNGHWKLVRATSRELAIRKVRGATSAQPVHTRSGN